MDLVLIGLIIEPITHLSFVSTAAAHSIDGFTSALTADETILEKLAGT